MDMVLSYILQIIFCSANGMSQTKMLPFDWLAPACCYCCCIAHCSFLPKTIDTEDYTLWAAFMDSGSPPGSPSSEPSSGGAAHGHDMSQGKEEDRPGNSEDGVLLFRY